ncbi:MAG: DNA gyrase/topoisomerase IV subunit A [Bacteroidaceae bacterium]|nr:DNA gyrase/topoisomerase IV subunit A [Bacteroidaceae bacterium]
MNDDEIKNGEELEEREELGARGEDSPSGETHASYNPDEHHDDPNALHRLGGMYQNWFLDYASYVILDRAVPHLGDGLKPVQRRLLHSMKQMDDGRLNKVANIVGNTMKYHPHGDASIYSALVTLGQKNLLIDCQGNWGNILTGDGAAAPRYIEARLSRFALDAVFNAKTTEWKLSYDGRNKEPITLPVKFPLLLCQGADGIAVGLSVKILPHNFNELCDAAVSYLNGQDFQLYPDFQTGGSIDVSHYNDGQRGGSVKIRAKINKVDNKTLHITEIPYSKTVKGVIESIMRAGEKGKIKIKHIDDTTSESVSIVVHLQPGVSPDKTLDALYAFTDCEVSVSPNCCVIDDRTPRFLTVSDVLRYSVDQTRELLKKELLIHKDELLEELHFASLESIFINERIYKDKEYENAKTTDEACEHIDERLTPWYPKMVREVTKDDILRLLEIRMKRILRFNKDKAEENILRLQAEIRKIDRDLKNLKQVTINWFLNLKAKYGEQYPRMTQIAAFDQIVAQKVTEQNLKLYVNREEGFIGTALKKDELVGACSDLDDVILFYRDGTYKVTRVADKLFVGETERSKAEGKKAEIMHVAVFKKNDKRTIYNVIYRDGRRGAYLMKRFFVSGITRDREYDLTQGSVGSRVTYFTSNPNGEAEVVHITLKPDDKIKKLTFDIDFADLAIKGRTTKGNTVTKNSIYRVNLKSHGVSTLGGRKVWFDNAVRRLNYDERGQLLGEFGGTDRVLVILNTGEYYATDTDINNHYEDNIVYIGKYRSGVVWTAVYSSPDTDGRPYIKRFQLEPSIKRQNFINDQGDGQMLLLSSEVYPLIKVTYGGGSSFREPLEIEVEEFIAVKGVKARGKRLTNYEVATIEELEPKRKPEPEEADDSPDAADDSDNGDTPDTEPDSGQPSDSSSEPTPETEKSEDEIRDEMNGQLRLF